MIWKRSGRYHGSIGALASAVSHTLMVARAAQTGAAARRKPADDSFRPASLSLGSADDPFRSVSLSLGPADGPFRSVSLPLGQRTVHSGQ